MTGMRQRAGLGRLLLIFTLTLADVTSKIKVSLRSLTLKIV